MFGYNAIPGLTGDKQTTPGIAVPGGIQAGGTITSPYVNVSTPSSNSGGINAFTDAGTGGLVVSTHMADGGTCVEADSFGANATSIYGFANGAGSTALYGQATGVGGVALHMEGLIRMDQAAAHTLGAYSGNAVPIYGITGTLLGYLPLYA